MIQLKVYTEKEGRDPNIYLGIDVNPIPIELFKGIFSTPRTIYSDDALYGIQILVTDDGKSVVLISDNKDSYITLEDIQSNDIWYKVGFVLAEYEEFTNFGSIHESVKNDPLTFLLERYHSGETGLLEFEEKRYNDKGEYMRIYKSFDTRQHPDAPDKKSAVLDQLRKHCDFIYFQDRAIPSFERRVHVKTNPENIVELENYAEAQLELMRESSPKLYDHLPEGEVRFVSCMIPGVGQVSWEKDDSIKDMLVTIKDK